MEDATRGAQILLILSLNRESGRVMTKLSAQLWQQHTRQPLHDVFLPRHQLLFTHTTTPQLEYPSPHHASRCYLQFARVFIIPFPVQGPLSSSVYDIKWRRADSFLYLRQPQWYRWKYIPARNSFLDIQPIARRNSATYSRHVLRQHPLPTYAHLFKTPKRSFKALLGTKDHLFPR